MAARQRGRITEWRDDNGFGFITPSAGGRRLFFHVSALQQRHQRPLGNELVTFEPTLNARGPVAVDVAYVGRAMHDVAPPPKRRLLPALLGLGFLATLGVLAGSGRVSILLPLFHAGMSLLTFLAYGYDKRAARGNFHRTPERTLHAWALFGGWPGAALAQWLLRHKSQKRSFQTTFAVCVVIHLAATGWLVFTREGQAFLERLHEAVPRILQSAALDRHPPSSLEYFPGDSGPRVAPPRIRSPMHTSCADRIEGDERSGMVAASTHGPCASAPHA